jgi:hypothetical protein
LKIDIIGDVHGHYDALVALGRVLGYDTRGGWTHPDGRLLVFVGDLIDRGPKSLEVAQLVADLVARRRALCLMGNHEYNLVRWRHGAAGPKHSNERTIADVQARPSDWEPVLAFLESLPLALELPELRVIHAVWHLGCFAQVHPSLRHDSTHAGGEDAAFDELCRHIALRSPFESGALREGLPREHVEPGTDVAHEVLIKGYEARVNEAFHDADGKPRTEVRVTWWSDPAAPVPRDRRTVFGHYWNVPPTAESAHAAPPHPSGHPRLCEWQREQARLLPAEGVLALQPEVHAICVDYNGVLEAGGGSCVGAYRWPEHQIAWARHAHTK